MDNHLHTHKKFLPLLGLFLALTVLSFNAAIDKLISDDRLSQVSDRLAQTVSSGASFFSVTSKDCQRGLIVTSDFMVATVVEPIVGLGQSFRSLFSALSDWWDVVKQIFINLWQKIKANWLAWLAGDFKNKDGQANSDLADPQLREQLKREIKSELEAELLNNRTIPGAVGINQDTVHYQGAVVLPSAGDDLSDEKLKANVTNSFSDPVNIKYDQSGRSGVVTPVFPGRPAENYIFVLTPIKKE